MALRSRSRDRIAFFGGNSALSPRKKSLSEKGFMRPISTGIESLPHESPAVKFGRSSAVETLQTVLTARSLPAEAFGVASFLPLSLGKAWGEKFPSLVGRGKASAVRAHGTRICHVPVAAERGGFVCHARGFAGACPNDKGSDYFTPFTRSGKFRRLH